ncbi:hypothetical protein [Paracnuella aquatica]|uniref:hypothetical protein n=1 Tax=Paracnuella aquatica TaxID=2268757 RepID=UPI0012D75D3A|nr:hypothetical protein [Paracnuella aquatica]
MNKEQRNDEVEGRITNKEQGMLNDEGNDELEMMSYELVSRLVKREMQKFDTKK